MCLLAVIHPKAKRFFFLSYFMPEGKYRQRLQSFSRETKGSLIDCLINWLILWIGKAQIIDVILHLHMKMLISNMGSSDVSKIGWTKKKITEPKILPCKEQMTQKGTASNLPNFLLYWLVKTMTMIDLPSVLRACGTLYLNKATQSFIRCYVHILKDLNY